MTFFFTADSVGNVVQEYPSFCIEFQETTRGTCPLSLRGIFKMSGNNDKFPLQSEKNH